MGYSLIIFGVSIVIALGAQMYVSINYNKYKKVSSKSNLSGFEVARKILDENNCKDTYVVETNGVLSDHYDPSRNTIKLSKDVFHGTNISSVSIAAHEASHVLQHKKGYNFLKIRNLIIPFVNFSSSASYVIILISFITNYMNLLYLGILLLVIVLFFQIITLPVEFNASSEAKKELIKRNILTKSEITKSTKVLNAAALTYVASVLVSLLEIARLLLLARDRD